MKTYLIIEDEWCNIPIDDLAEEKNINEKWKAKFVVRLKEILAEKELTQVDLAKALHTTEATISRYATGKRIPKAPLICEMAAVLGVSLEYLNGVE